MEGLGQELPVDDAHLVGGPALGIDARVRERLRPGRPPGRPSVVEQVGGVEDVGPQLDRVAPHTGDEAAIRQGGALLAIVRGTDDAVLEEVVLDADAPAVPFAGRSR